MNCRVAIIEDDGVVRHHIADLLADSDRYRLAWTAPDLAAARAMLPQPFNLLLLDLGLPDGRGIELMPHIRSQVPGVVVIAFTVFEDEENVIEAIEAGVDGYALKTTEAQALIDTLDSAMRGENPISPSVAGYLFKRLRRSERESARDPMRDPARASTQAPHALMQLTPRERDVLEALARGLSYREAADTLGISINTLSHHVKNFYPKLAVTSRSEAIRQALRDGIIQLDG